MSQDLHRRGRVHRPICNRMLIVVGASATFGVDHVETFFPELANRVAKFFKNLLSIL